MPELRREILGIGFDNISFDDAVARAFSMLKEPRRHYIVTPNAEIAYICRGDDEARRAINDADMVLPDGIGIIYASLILGRRINNRVPGIDFVSGLMSVMARSGHSLYLLGAKPGVAEKAAERLAEKYPGLRIAGTHDGYFTDNDKVIQAVNSSRADVVFVCLGAPKQEIWMRENIGLVDARLMVGLGGSLDHFAGDVKRAPLIMRKLGLEWLYRAVTDPSRKKRLVNLPLFLFEVIKERIGMSHK